MIGSDNPQATLGFTILVAIPTIVFGGFLAWYGNQLVEKAKHVAWTKEGLREYERARTKALREIGADTARLAQPSYIPSPTNFPSQTPRIAVFCPNCGISAPGLYFCKGCGARLPSFT